MALAQGVQSTNVVGYTTISAAENVFTPMAIMFTDVSQNTIAITSLVFDGIQRYDQIQIFDGYGDVATTIEMGRNAWDDDSYVFQPGDAFWLSPQGDVTVTFPAPTLAQ